MALKSSNNTPSTGGPNTGIKQVAGKSIGQIDKSNITLINNINGNIFTRFDNTSDVLLNLKETISDTCWINSVGTLNTVFTSSAETALSSSYYYWNIYSTSAYAVSSSSPQFSIAYGHINGSGSATGSIMGYTGNLSQSRTPSKSTYNQYKNILLNPSDTQFTFGSATPSDIIVINMARAQYKEKIDNGNWELKLSGSKGILSLMDNSATNTNPTIGSSGRVYNIVSGSLAAGTSSHNTVFGLCYPDVGILILNATAVEASCSIGLSTVTGNTGNHKNIYTAISGGASFICRNEEVVNSAYYFVRIKNTDFNYSNNPTYTTGSIGLIKLSSFVSNPVTYITTVGLYNDSYELLGVAKLSKPLKKSFTTEANIRVRLDF